DRARPVVEGPEHANDVVASEIEETQRDDADDDYPKQRPQWCGGRHAARADDDTLDGRDGGIDRLSEKSRWRAKWAEPSCPHHPIPGANEAREGRAAEEDVADHAYDGVQSSDNGVRVHKKPSSSPKTPAIQTWSGASREPTLTGMIASETSSVATLTPSWNRQPPALRPNQYPSGKSHTSVQSAVRYWP